MLVPYGAVVFYLLLCAGLLSVNWKQNNKKKKSVIEIACAICAMKPLKRNPLLLFPATQS